MDIKRYILELNEKVEFDRKYRDISFSYADKFTITNLINHCFMEIQKDVGSKYFQVLLDLQALLYYILTAKDRDIGENLWGFVSEFDRAIHPELQERYLEEIKNGSFQNKINWIDVMKTNNWYIDK